MDKMHQQTKFSTVKKKLGTVAILNWCSSSEETDHELPSEAPH